MARVLALIFGFDSPLLLLFVSPKYGTVLTVDVTLEIFHVFLGLRPDALEVELTLSTPCVALGVVAVGAAVLTPAAADEVGTSWCEDCDTSLGSSNRPRNMGVDVVAFLLGLVFSDSFDMELVVSAPLYKFG